METEHEGDKKEAAFNMAVKYLERLHDLLYNANQAAINEDLYAWYRILSAIHREISPKLTAEEKKEYPIIMEKLNDPLNVFYNKRKNNPGKYIESWDMQKPLTVYDMTLRRHIDAHGLLMPSKKDIDKLMDNA